MLALLPILLSLAPSLISAIAGDRAGNVATQAVDLAKAIAGTDDENEAAAVIASDPAKATELSVALAKISAEAKASQAAQETARIQAILGDVANARQMTSQSPLIAKAQVGFGIIILLMFLTSIVLLAFIEIPDKNQTLVNVLFTAETALVLGLAAFFYGNSTSGHSANNAMASIAQRSASPQIKVVETSASALNDAVMNKIRNR